MKYTLLILCLLTACKASRPARKLLPVATLALREQSKDIVDFVPGEALITYDDTLISGQHYLELLLPEPDNDSVLVGMVRTGLFLLPELLTQLAGRAETGVVIDLRTEGRRLSEEYSLLVNGTRTPVVFVYDAGSRLRYELLSEALQDLPGVEVKKRAEVNYGDCFSRSLVRW